MASSRETLCNSSAQERSGDSLYSEEEVQLPTVNERLGKCEILHHSKVIGPARGARISCYPAWQGVMQPVFCASEQVLCLVLNIITTQLCAGEVGS